MDKNSLPKSWQIKTLGEVCEIISKGTTPKEQKNEKENSTDVYFLKVENLTNDFCVNLSNTKFISFQTHTNQLKRSILKDKDILISIAGTLGRVAIINISKDMEVNLNQAICFIRLDKNQNLNYDFIKFCLASQQIQIKLLNQAKITAIPNLTLETIRKLQIPLPSVAEQREIVGEIERRFEKLDKAIENFRQILKNLKLYRQGVLKFAFDGKFTNPNLTNWQTKPLGEVAQIKGGKRLPKGSDYSKDITKHPYIRVTNFENMSVNLNDIKYITDEIYNTIKNYTISKDDVYISIAGSIGKAGIIPDELDNANLTENAAKIIHNINKKYLAFYLNSQEAQNTIKKFTKSTTQPKLALYRIEEIQIPIPPLSEQKQIVSEIEKRFAKADKIENLINKSIKNAEILKQSILKQAFSGNLKVKK